MDRLTDTNSPQENIKKTLMVVIDGMENSLYSEMELLSKHGIMTGCKNNTPIGMETDSLACIMTLLGVKPEHIPYGRSYIEAAALDLDILESDIVLRGNLIDVDHNNILTSSCKDGIVGDISNDKLTLKHIGKHKYLIILKNCKQYFDTVKTFPPHQNIGKRLDEITHKADPYVKSILDYLLYEKHIFAWGQSVKQQLPSFNELNNKSGAIVAKTEIAVGIAKATSMYCPKLSHATGDTDTDLSEKVSTALSLTEHYDFVMLHINGADECSHRRDTAEKYKFIQRIDKEVIGYLIENISSDINVIITSDHETSSLTGKHINSSVYCYSLKYGDI